MPPPNTPTRKLAAIMFTDIAGFTALSAKDENKALELLDKQKQLLTPIIEEFNGTLHKEVGDGLLLTFPTVTDAIKCGIKIQEKTKEVENLNLRIGIHEGEITLKDGDALGDDVNITSRIESYAAVGGIAITGKIQQNISSLPEFETKFISQPSLKGVRQDVKVYCITSHGLPETEITKVTAKLEKDVKKLWFNQKFIIGAIGLLAIAVIGIYSLIPKEKEVPSVGILMMENRGVQDDKFWAMGITEDLIVKVAGAGRIRVTPMKEILGIDPATKLEEIARELRVKYLLTSSMHKKEDGFDLRCQLIEAESGISKYANKWSEPLDNSPKIVGNLADDILKTLKVSSKQEITKAPTTNAEAYEFYLKAKYKFEKREDMEDTEIARGLVNKAIELDDKLLLAKNLLGETYQVTGDYGKAMEIYIENLKQAEELGDKRRMGGSLNGIGSIYNNEGDYEKALDYYTRSLAIREELGDKYGIGVSLHNIGIFYHNTGDYEKALDYHTRSLKTCEELGDKRGMGYSFYWIGIIYDNKGDYEKALDYHTRSLSIREELGDKRGIGASLNNIGWLYYEMGELTKAIEYYDKELSVRKELKDENGIVNIYNNYGLVYLKQNDFNKALENLDKSATMQIGLNSTITLETLSHLFLSKKKLSKEYDEKEIHKIIKEQEEIEDYINYALYQLLEDTSYLETAYNQVQEKADDLEPTVKAKFLSYPIPKAIVEAWEKIQK